MRPLIIAAAIAVAAAQPAWALKEPAPGKTDPRMVTADYDPTQVYAVHVPQGQTLAITLAPTEVATDGFGADQKQIRAEMVGNIVVLWSSDVPVPPRSMFIRSRTQDGKSRTYAILVDTRPPEQAPISLTFTYPADDAAERAVIWRQHKADRDQRAAEMTLAMSSGAADTNQHYVLQGETPEDWNLLPTREVSDNGSDTHFHFPGAMRVPLIYAAGPDGKDSVVEPTFNSQTGVATVHQLAKVFHLRDGDALLCIYNRAYDPIGIHSPTGTVSPDVQRETMRQ